MSSGSSQPPRRPRPQRRRPPARASALPQVAGLPPWALPATGAVVLLLLLLLLLRGCGDDGLSPDELRAQATAICARANDLSDRIAVPNAPAGGERYLVEGLTIMRPALRRLQLLKPPEELRDQWEDALRRSDERLTLIARTARQISRGGDAIDEYRALQRQLDTVEIAVTSSWRALDLPVCAGR